MFPNAIQIMDKFHAKQYLSELAKLLYGTASPQARIWAQRRHRELDTGRFDNLLRAVRRHADRSDEACKLRVVRARRRCRIA